MQAVFAHMAVGAKNLKIRIVYIFVILIDVMNYKAKFRILSTFFAKDFPMPSNTSSKSADYVIGFPSQSFIGNRSARSTTKAAQLTLESFPASNRFFANHAGQTLYAGQGTIFPAAASHQTISIKDCATGFTRYRLISGYEPAPSRTPFLSIAAAPVFAAEFLGTNQANIRFCSHLQGG